MLKLLTENTQWIIDTDRKKFARLELDSKFDNLFISDWTDYLWIKFDKKENIFRIRTNKDELTIINPQLCT